MEANTAEPHQRKPLRLWPGVSAAILLFLVKLIIPVFMPDALPIALLGGLLFGLVIIVWWAFFSRASRFERWGATGLMIIALIAVRPLLHPSIAQGGQGMLFPVLAIPMMSLVFVAWVVLSRAFSDGLRRVTMAAAIVIAVGGWTLVRTGGINNKGNSDFAWRWSDTPEERLMVQTGEETYALPSTAEGDTAVCWPGFRGPGRDGIIRGVRIKTDWQASKPVELWRRPIGPAWSSFAVRGNLLYTQEQRGDIEIVSCYTVSTGIPVWKHQDKTRFWESNSGPGPRATPTLSGGRVYACGATGILNALDAGNGSVVWSRNAGEDTRTKVPIWGFSGSPLVMDDLVIVAVAGSLIAYDLATGNPRWMHREGGDCYSSPHLLHINDVAQILLQNEAGVMSVSPSDGKLLWKHPWPGHPIVQPALAGDGDLLISADERTGVRRITVSPGPREWTVIELWTSVRVRPYFNDSIIHNGCIFGFDGPSLACIDLRDGTRKWKGGSYGRGQILLLADQDVLLALSEKGELALVDALPDRFTELARHQAITGKTWNHPALAGDILLVRNDREMAAFRLKNAESHDSP